MDNKLLTIAVPVYNGSKTISYMLDRLLPQVNDEIEILISNNASTDNSDEIIRGYIKKYPFIKYFKHEKNQGADWNFLFCMKNATGKFTMLISDDDIITEGAVQKIVSFLHKYPNVQLVYLYTIGFNEKYIDIEHCHEYKEQVIKIPNDMVTKNKNEFFNYAKRMWGFTSSFLWSTDRFNSISNIDNFIGTYFLQGYLAALCSDKEDDELGIIKYPCIAAGEYCIINNYDTAVIEGIYFKRMFDFTIMHSKYDKKLLTNYWLWQVCYLSRGVIMKEKVFGYHKCSYGVLFKQLFKYPYAWFRLFPYMLVPKFLCKLKFDYNAKKYNYNVDCKINRPTE